MSFAFTKKQKEKKKHTQTHKPKANQMLVPRTLWHLKRCKWLGGKKIQHAPVLANRVQRAHLGPHCVRGKARPPWHVRRATQGHPRLFCAIVHLNSIPHLKGKWERAVSYLILHPRNMPVSTR